MKKVLIFLFGMGLLLSGSLTMVAQDKAACNPSNCGPNNTKKEEAAVIKEMRKHMEAIRDLAVLQNIPVDKGEVSFQTLRALPLDIEGNSEDASIYMLYLELEGYKRAVLDEPESLPSFSNKAQLVASMQKDMERVSGKLGC